MTKPKTLIPVPSPREEADRVLYGDAVTADLRQLRHLMSTYPDLNDQDLAHRMAKSVREIRKLKRRFV